MIRIVWAEPSDHDRTLIRTCMRLDGLHASTFFVDPAPKTFEIAQALRPNLIVIDIALQGQETLSALTSARGQSAFATTPVLVFTGSESTALMRLANDAGVTDFIQKPFNMPDFRKAVGLIVSRAKSNPIDLPTDEPPGRVLPV